MPKIHGDLEHIKIKDSSGNWVVIRQPDADGFQQNWETTYTEDSGRVMTGQAQLEPLFTVENISCKWTNVWRDDVSEILKLIVPTANKPTFTLHYWSWYYNKWRDDEFYVGKGTLDVNQINGDYTKVKSITCNLIGVNPLI